MRGFVLVDDGYPESSDYENNYFGFDPREPGDYERALAEAHGDRDRNTAGGRRTAEPPVTPASLWRRIWPALRQCRG